MLENHDIFLDLFGEVISVQKPGFFDLKSRFEIYYFSIENPDFSSKTVIFDVKITCFVQKT